MKTLSRIFVLLFFSSLPQLADAGRILGENTSANASDSEDEEDLDPEGEEELIGRDLLDTLNFNEPGEQGLFLPSPNEGFEAHPESRSVLGGLLYAVNFHTSTWYEPLLTSLAPLDLLSFAAISREARERIELLGDRLRNRLRSLFVLDIAEEETLQRWSALPVHTLPHLMGLHFSLDDRRIISPARIVRFLRERAVHLPRLSELEFSGLRNIWRQLLTEATEDDHLRRVLLQTRLPLIITFGSEKNVSDFLALVPLIRAQGLDAFLELEFFYDADTDIRHSFFQRLQQPLAIHRLRFDRAIPSPVFMESLARAISEESVYGIQTLEFVQAGLLHEDYELLSDLIASHRLDDLTTLEIDDSGSDAAATPEHAIGALLSAFLQETDVAAFLPRLRRFIFITSNHVGAESARAFGLFLRLGGLPALRILELGGDVGVLIPELIRAAPQLQNLEVLDLQGQMDVSAFLPQLRRLFPKCNIKTGYDLDQDPRAE